MNQTPIESEESEAVLVCGDCGRVNQVPQGTNRSTAVRCSGCGNLLRGERPRKISLDCPECQSRLEVEPAWLGHKIMCGACSAQFVAQRAGEFALPGKPSGGVPIDVSQRVGIPDVEPASYETTEEEVVDEHGRRKRVRRTRKKKRVREKSWRKVILFGLSTLATFTIVIGVIVEVGRRSGWWLQPAVPPVAKTEEPAGPSVPVMESSESPALESCLKTFLLATTPDELLGCVRFPSSVGVRMRKYYETHMYQPPGVRQMELANKLVVGNRLMFRYKETAAKDKPISMVIERLGPGEFLVDWDSHVRYASMDWETFLAKRPTDPQRFQCYVKRDFVGNSHYPVEEYSAYLMYWTDDADGVALFVKRESEQEKHLLAATEPQRKISPLEQASMLPGGYPMTLQVRFAPAANAQGQPPALELTEFVHDGWVNTASGRE